MGASSRAVPLRQFACAAITLVIGTLMFAVLPVAAHADDLADGEYTVEYQVMSAATPSQASMADAAFQKPLHVSVKDGAYTATITLGPNTIGTLTAYLKELYYWDGSAYSQVSYSDYYDVVDDFNKNADGKAAYRYPKTMSFPLVNKQAGDANGYVKIRVFVPLMDSIQSGAGSQEALLKIDWSTVTADAAANVRNQLSSALVRAKSISNDSGIYTAASYRALQDAIVAAESVAADSGSTEQAMQDALDKLTAAQDALVTQASVDQTAADTVAEQINALPVVDSLTLADESAVTAAQSAYDALSEAQKALVSSSDQDTLSQAVQKIAQLKQAAADRQAADAVIAQIDALPASNALVLSDRTAVETAANAYEALTDVQKTLVDTDTYATLQQAQARIEQLIDEADQDAKDQSAAASVVAQIKALPATEGLTLDDATAVQTVRAAYDALTEAAQSLVQADESDAYGTLTAAEGKITQLQQAADQVKDAITALPSADALQLSDKATVQAARAAYDALDASQQAYVGSDALSALKSAESRITALEEAAQQAAAQAAIDKERADSVAAVIANLPSSSTLSLADAEAVSNARAAYDALTEAQKALASDALATLEQAEQRLASLQASKTAADSAVALIDKLPDAGAVKTSSEAAITAARAAYNALDADAKGMVLLSDYNRLTAAEKALQAAKSSAAAAKKKAAVAKKTTAKKANPITVKASKKTLKYKTLKKKALKVTLKVSKAKGKVTFKKAKSAGIYKKVSISSKGKITFKKKAKKGTYSFKVKAAGNASYKAKTVTVKIKVK